MSIRVPSITCPHGRGLACRSCYDQRYGSDFQTQPRSPSVRTIDDLEVYERDTRAVVDRMFLGFEDL